LLVLFSDGVVEAHAENSDDVFGFERLESVLTNSATRGVRGVCEAILEALERHTGGAPLEDDLTLLVLQIP